MKTHATYAIHKWRWLTVWSFCLTFFCYRVVLHLPLFADDFFQFPFVTSHTLPQLWQTAEGLFFFRPVAFTLWKVMELSLGGHHPTALHALNLLLHAVNGVVVGWLAEKWHLLRRQTENLTDHTTTLPSFVRPFLATTLFLLYPFNYEAVAWVAAVMHPQVVAMILWGVVGYLKWREGNGRFWGILSLLAVFFAPFAHENGVLAAPLIAVVELTYPTHNTLWWQRVWRLVLWGVPVVLWFFVWRSVPAQDGAGSLALNSGKTMWQNGLYFIQGVAYPITWMGGWLRDKFALNGFVITAVLSLCLLLGAALAQWRSHTKETWLPWLWIGLAVAPAILFLPFLHVSAAPRMLMLPAVGIVWLWTEVIYNLVERASTHYKQSSIRLIVVIVTGLLLLQNLFFIQAQMNIYQLGGAAIQQAVLATTTANTQGKTAVFINFPAWIAPLHATYPIGQEGDIFILGADHIEPMITVHTNQPAQASAVRYDAIRQETPYYVGPVGTDPNWSSLQSATQVFVTHYSPNGITIHPAGTINIGDFPSAPLAHFSPAITLLAGAAHPQESLLQIELTWMIEEPITADITLFVHVIDANGQLVVQADGDLLAGTYPFSQWPLGSVVTDQRSISLDGLPAGFVVRVGLYDRLTGERLPATNPIQGQVFPDNAVTIFSNP